MTAPSAASERQALTPSIPFRHYVTLGFGIIVGVGWVVYSGQWLQDGGPLGAMLAFLLGGLMLLPIGACYAEMTAALPLAGGELSFAYKAFGVLPGFLTAWALALGYVSVTPFETIAIGSLLEALVPALESKALYFVGPGETMERVSWSTILPGVLTGSLLLWVNYRGARHSARVQSAIVYTMLAATLLFTGFALLRGDFSNLMPLFPPGTGAGNPVAAAAAPVVAVLVVVPFFMAGFDAIPQAAEEAGVNVPPRQLGLAILASIVCGCLFYVLIVLAVSVTMPWTESSRLPMTTATVFEIAFGSVWAAKLVILTALLGLVSTLNGMYVAASRLLFSLGRGGLLPEWFAAVHPVHGTPSNALLFVGALSLLGPFIGEFALAPIVSCGSLMFCIALAMTAASAVRLRRSAPTLPRPYRARLPIMYVGTAVSLVLILLMVLPSSPGSLDRLEWLVVAVWMGLGSIAFLWSWRRRPISPERRDYLVLGDYR